jgi:putative heme transporter
MRRLRTRGPQPSADPRPTQGFEPQDLTGLFAAPRWLRDLGATAWLAVGVTLFVVGLVWIAALTQAIVAPVITAAVIAAVAAPVVDWLHRLGIGRGLAAALLLVAAVVLAVCVVLVVVGGITGESDALRDQLGSARDTLVGWANDLGVDRGSAESADQDAASAVADAVPALLKGLVVGLAHLSSLAFFLALTALSLFFLLKDGPLIRAWTEGHMRVRREAAHQITGRVLESLRGYFFGVTLVAIFNAVVVGVGALILGIPLAGTIAAITFIGAYIPYLGAWGAGAFAVLLALGGAGTDAAVGMIVIQLLANGILQQMVQPIAYGAALGIHPLAVLIVTIAGGALFGAVGLILAAPLTSAVTRIAADLARDGTGAATQPATEPAT